MEPGHPVRTLAVKLRLPTTLWILMANSQKLSFLTLKMKSILTFFYVLKTYFEVQLFKPYQRWRRRRWYGKQGIERCAKLPNLRLSHNSTHLALTHCIAFYQVAMQYTLWPNSKNRHWSFGISKAKNAFVNDQCEFFVKISDWKWQVGFLCDKIAYKSIFVGWITEVFFTVKWIWSKCTTREVKSKSRGRNVKAEVVTKEWLNEKHEDVDYNFNVIKDYKTCWDSMLCMDPTLLWIWKGREPPELQTAFVMGLHSGMVSKGFLKV